MRHSGIREYRLGSLTNLDPGGFRRTRRTSPAVIEARKYIPVFGAGGRRFLARTEPPKKEQPLFLGQARVMNKESSIKFPTIPPGIQRKSWPVILDRLILFQPAPMKKRMAERRTSGPIDRAPIKASGSSAPAMPQGPGHARPCSVAAPTWAETNPAKPRMPQSNRASAGRGQRVPPLVEAWSDQKAAAPPMQTAAPEEMNRKPTISLNMPGLLRLSGCLDQVEQHVLLDGRNLEFTV